MTAAHPFVPYPPIERHGVIGDRRTAALVAADGTLDWLCLPAYDSPPLFGVLRDTEQGGFWRFGPTVRCPQSGRAPPDDARWTGRSACGRYAARSNSVSEKGAILWGSSRHHHFGKSGSPLGIALALTSARRRAPVN